MAKQWTQKEIKKLKSLKEKGLKYKQIADKLNRSVNAIKIRASELGLTDPVDYYSEKEIETLKQMALNGFSDSEIADKLNRSRDSVMFKRKKLGIRRKTGTWSNHEIQKLKDMLDKEYDISEIAIKLNRNFLSVSNKVKELNYKVEEKDNKHYKIVKNCLVVLKIISEGKNVNRNDLAEVCNVHPRTISRYLNILREIGYDIRYNQNNRCYELNKQNSKLEFLNVNL